MAVVVTPSSTDSIPEIAVPVPIAGPSATAEAATAVATIEDAASAVARAAKAEAKAAKFGKKLMREMKSAYDVVPSEPLRRALPTAERTLATSNFKKVYGAMLDAGVPRRSTLLLFAVEKLVQAYARKDSEHMKKHYESSLEEFTALAFRQMGETLADDVSAAAEFLWTSTQRFGKVEFCALLNTVIREDRASSIAHACVVVCSINRLRLGERVATGSKARKSKGERFPNRGRLYRGSALPNFVRPFYEKGKSFRVPAFFATSFSKKVAKKFAARVSGSPVCMWRIQLDMRGKKDPLYRCKHAALVYNTLVKGEHEYLFAPYSVFTINEVRWASSRSDPHKIVMSAAIDNKIHSEDLPLAPWY